MFANLRDVGGLSLIGGGVTRPGVLYRGDVPAPEGSTPELNGWPPSLVVDLRSDEEAEKRDVTWPGATQRVGHPLHDALALAALGPGSDLAELYTAILDGYSERVTAPLSAIAAAEGPVLIHCTAGKDRTGIMVAALLLAAGVEPDDVRRDYAQTNHAVPAIQARLAPEIAKHGVTLDNSWWQAQPAAIEVVVDRLTAWPGGPRQWWLDHGASESDLTLWAEKLRGE
ncbi:MAG TPA: tyrosine-protein phosphatase [Nocardioidaceae bacterium]|nr:tyrosine-protein phosphatase [Nocardioidaceae bacterium]